MSQGPVSPWADRRELGEGARRVDGGAVLIDVPGFPAAAYRSEAER
jgi:hypothetical protein